MSFLSIGESFVFDCRGDSFIGAGFSAFPEKGYTRFSVERLSGTTSIEFKAKNTEYLIFTSRRTKERVLNLIRRISRDISDGTFDGIDRYYVPAKNLPYA